LIYYYPDSVIAGVVWVKYLYQSTFIKGYQVLCVR
jgi:hypothetical protein